MGEWRHVKEWDGMCSTLVPLDAMSVTPCDCTIPYPDPASPCAVCGYDILQNLHDLSHRHVATRCTCGHTIEEARK